MWSMAKGCVHPSEEQEDFKVRTQNRFEVLVLQEICNVKPELEAFDLTMADSDSESAEVPPPQNHACSAEVGFGEWNPAGGGSDPGTRK